MPEIFTAEDFARATDVSRETFARLKAYAGLLEEWNARHNLVAKSTLPELWQRHFLDSAQLLPLIPPEATSLADLGSGAGFPGLVLACLLRERPGFRSALFEATGKKAAFLTAAAERMGLNVEVRNMRMEDAPAVAFDVVSARACAPLEKLLGYAQKFAGPKTVCLFLKGQNVEVELTEARKSWRMKALRHQSRTSADGAILEIRELRHART